MEHSDTLDIRPIDPQASSKAPESIHAAHISVDASHTDHDSNAAAAARAQIEALHQSVGTAHSTGIAELSPSQKPVSPAQEHFSANEHFSAAQSIKHIADKAHSLVQPVLPDSKEDHEVDPEPAKSAKKLPSRLKPIITATATFLLILIVIKSPVLLSQINYLLGDRPSVNEQIGETLPSAGGTAVSTTPLLTINKLNVKAPVIFENSMQESQIQHALEGGVVHYGTTALPGQPGNSVIVGHSSNDWWEPGNYKFVFVLLDKMVVGDTMTIDYNSIRYFYEVTEVKVVKPTDLSVLSPTPDPELTLITCTPPGFSTNRLIIRAKQTSPVPGQAAPTSQPTPALTDNNALPGNAPSFTDQIAQAWKSFTEALFGRPVPATPTSGTNAPQSLPGAK